jgi:acetylglutamate kinase
MADKLKMVAAVVVATLAALIAALGPGDGGSLSNLDGKTWAVAILAVLTSGALVFFVSNIRGVAGGIAKAVQALLSAGIASLVVALDESSAGGAHITQSEWLVAISAAVVASGIVYQLPGPTHPDTA